MGRPRKPTALKLLQGTYTTNRAVKDEPVYQKPKEIKAPDHLDGFALSKWNELAPLLHEQGVLTAVDMQNLECFCNAYRTYREAYQKVEREGAVIQSVKGQIKNPAWTVCYEAQLAMLKYSATLGLDPASRTKISGSPKKTSNSFNDQKGGKPKPNPKK